MEPKMYLYAFSNHQETIVDKLSDKKKQLKNRVNRADNFVNLSLLGVEKCLNEMCLEKETNLYLSSQNGNINATIKILDAIFKKNQLPMPFNFLNSVNASILFFIAKSFGIEGKALFTDTFESALVQAYVDVKNGKTILLGHVNEAIADLELHRKKFNVSEIIEESQWLLLSPNIEGETAIAKISDLKIDTSKPKRKHTVNDLFTLLENQNSLEENIILSSFAHNTLSFKVTKC